MKTTSQRYGFFARLTWGLFLTGLLAFGVPSYAGDIQVDSADPPEAEQATYDLEVTVAGDGFGPDSEVDFFVAGTADPGGIKVKKVKRKNPKTLKVTIDVAPDAQIEKKFDIEVRSRGRTGKGTELFRVLEKPKPQEEVWLVELPDEDMALSDCIDHLFEGQTSADCNLYASGSVEGPEWVNFVNSENVEVDVSVNKDPETGQTYTVFDLMVAEPNSIGFRNLGFQGCKSYCSQGGEGPCTGQVFPGSLGQDCCDVDCCTTGDQSCGTGYWVMRDFMEGSLHPREDYDHFSLRFIVWTDIDALPDGPTNFAEADLWRLNLWNTDEVMEGGAESDHNVVGAYWIPLEDVVVERAGDEWTVTVNQCGFEGVDGCPGSDIVGQTNRPIVFWETYYQGILTPIGKSGKFNLDSEYRWAVGSGTHFRFVTKWKRISIQ
jgi:hypothetical protein